MDFGQILGQLQGQLGDKVDLSAIKDKADLNKLPELLNGIELPEAAKGLVSMLQGLGVGALDGDGVQESLVDELKGKAEQMLGGLFGK